MSVARAFASLGGIGHLPVAPGTWASAATIPVVWLMHWAGGFWLVGPATLAVCVLGYWATARVIEGPEDDPSWVVVDEAAGMMLALWPLSLGLTLMGAPGSLFPYPGWALAFLMFRALDITKPWPVSAAERTGGALGVMLDDVVAGLITAGVAALAAAIAHGWL